MKPSDFTAHPWSSILYKSEAETIARNIMVILKRTGNEWRELSWEEYKTERLKDGGFTQSERRYFDDVIAYTTSPEQAAKFSEVWNKVYNPAAV